MKLGLYTILDITVFYGCLVKYINTI